MSPNPDFGYDTYKGYGRLKGKVLAFATSVRIWPFGTIRWCDERTLHSLKV